MAPRQIILFLPACTSALTLIGYSYIASAFLMSRSIARGGELVFGDLRMRRI